MEKDNKPSKRAKITTENVAESVRLKAIWDQKAKITQEKFGLKYDVGTQGMVWQYLNHRSPLNPKAAVAFSTELGCDIADFSPRLAAEIEGLSRNTGTPIDDDFADVRMLDVKASAGHGSVPHIEEELGVLKFRRDWLRAVGVSESNAVVITVKGASMEPTIADGAALLINRSHREPHAGAIYVFHVEGNGLVVKRVVRVGDRWMARSDNEDRTMYPDFAFADGATLIGRAVWMGTKL